MEDFLKEKLSHGEMDFTDDWPAFEQKLERALFFKQMRVGALVSVVLIMLSIGFFGSSSFSRFNVFQNGNQEQENSYRGEGRFSDFNADKKAVYQSEAETRRVFELTKETSVEIKRNIESPEPTEVAVPSSISETNNAEVPKIENSNKIAGITESGEGGRNSTKQSAGTVIEDEASSTTGSSGKVLEIREPTLLVAMVEPKGLEIEEGGEETPEPSQKEINKVAGQSTATAQSYKSAGLALVPDGSEGSNYKFNTKPIELMVDPQDLNTMSLKAPVIPMKLVQAKKEAYVSPLQEKKPWSYSIKVYPNFTYRKFSVAANKMPYIHRDFIDQVEVSETGGFSLNVGFEASKRIGRITYLNGGVEYISYKTEANFDFMNYRDAVIDSESGKITSYDFRNEAEHIVIVDANRYHYLNFPLSISYRPWATDHVRINIEAGASYMYFAKASGKTIDYQSLEVIDLSDREYRNSMASICFKVGASYHVSEQFSLGFEPTVVYFSNTIYTEEYPFEVVPYSVGVNFKLQMKLN